MRAYRALLVLAASLVASAQPLYDFDATSPVVELTDANFDELMSGDATSVWVVEYYADWCGHCKQFAKGYLKAADSLRGIVKFGAVNAANNPKTASANGVQGYPTVKLYMPELRRNPYTGKLNKPVVEYSGPRSARGVADFASAAIPSSHVVPVEEGGLDAFLGNGSLPKAVLLGSKPELTPLLKAVGLALHGRMLIGFSHGPTSPQTASALGGGEASFPRLLVLTAGASAADAIAYGGEMKPSPMLSFLMSHAAPPPTGGAAAAAAGRPAASLVKELDQAGLDALPRDAHILAFGDVPDLEPLAESIFGQAVVARAPAALASKYGAKSVPAVAVLRYGAAEKAPKKAVAYAGDAAGLEGAKKTALASLPETQVERLGPANMDIFFSSALGISATQAACLLFSDKGEVPPLFRALSVAFEEQIAFGFAPASLMSQFGVDKVPAVLVLFAGEPPAGKAQGQQVALQGVRFEPQVHGKFNFGNIASFLASFIESRLVELGASAGAAGGGSPDPDMAMPSKADAGPLPELSASNWGAECLQRGGLCAVALLDGGPDNTGRKGQLEMLTQLRARRAGGPLAFSWLDATCHSEFISAFGLTESDLPTMLVLSPSKLRWARSIGSFDAETVGAFGSAVASGRKPTETIAAIPPLQPIDCAALPRGAAAVEEDDPLGAEIMAEILEEERREREAREAAVAEAAAAAGAGAREPKRSKSEMSEIERMEAELEECGSMDLLCAARRDKQLKALEKKRQLEEKLKKIAKKKKKAKAKAKKGGQ